jgi:hypothetical protein
MVQHTHQAQTVDNGMVYEASAALGRVLVAVMKAPFKIIRGTAREVAYGFQIFTDTAEQHGLPRK